MKVCSGLQDETQDGHINSQGVGTYVDKYTREISKRNFLLGIEDSNFGVLSIYY